MNILFIGDIFGSSGREVIFKYLKTVKEKYSIDLVIANAENAAHGKGLTPKIYKQIVSYGVDFITMGNHTWSKPEVNEILDYPNIVRPFNIKQEFIHAEYGTGSREILVKNLRIRITNLLGSSIKFRDMQTNPFLFMSNFLTEIQKPDIHIVDFHAETTSEKYAFLWAFDGKVDAILGTHTHVPTNDACLTKKNTAFLCDVGMTGPSQGVIGGERTSIISKFFNYQEKFILKVQEGPKQLSSVILHYDEELKVISKITPLIFREGFESLGISDING